MMSIRVVNAGDGYAYLLRNVATADVDTGVKTKLGDYYQATGTPPGRWYGRGLTGLDSTAITSGTTVTEEHMAALYGEGLHPEADSRIANGASIADVQLGRAYPFYSGGHQVLKELSAMEKQFRYHAGRRPTEQERNTIAVDVARKHYSDETGYSNATPKEILAWVNEKKNSVRQATAGFDLTFSPAKSISVLWALGDEETRKTIESVHSECVSASLDWLDNNALRTRCEVNGVKKLTRTRGLIAAQFVHYDTRSGDPDLHTHCLVSNKVQGPDGKWRSVDSRSLMKSAVAASTHYNALMMQRLGDELDLAFTNYETDPAKQPVWEVAGIDPKMIAHFSKRRAGARPRYEQLREAYQQAHGRTPGLRASRKLWQQAVLDTRPSKDSAQSLRSLRQTWQAEARQFFGNSATDAVEKNVSHATDTRAIAPAVDSEKWRKFVTEQAESSIALAVSRRSEFRRHHLHTAVEQELSAWFFPSQRARALATAHVMDRALASAVRLTPQPSYHIPGRLLTEDGELFDRSADHVVYTSADVLAAENTVLDSAVEPTAHVVTNAEIDRALARHQQAKGFALNAGQEALTRHLLSAGMQTVAGVGPAGTGKTASMAVVADTWRNSGKQVFALAPSAVAAKTLGEDINETGHTLASLTYRWRGKIGSSPKNADAIQRAIGKTIRPGDMLLVDEAGMASTDDLAAIVEIADETGAVVRMVGDPYQLDAVETGGLFRTVCKRTSAVELDQVMRQGDDTAQAHAGLKIRRGDASGLDEYDRRGWISGGTRSDMVSSAVDAWLADFDRGRSTLLVASTNAVVDDANTRIQRELIDRGKVQASAGWLARLLRKNPPQAQLGDHHTAYVGDTILTRRNQVMRQPDGSEHKILNGQKWQIDRIGKDGSITAINTENGRGIVLDADYVRQHCQLGYASTIHRAQGVTVDTTHAVVDSTTDRRGLYVALTRGRAENHVWAITDTSIDEAEEEAHLHMDGDAHAPTARDVLTRAVHRDHGHVAATDIAENLANQDSAPQRQRQLYRTAVQALAADYAASATERLLDELPINAANRIDQQAVSRIRTAAGRAALRGVDLRDHLAQVCRYDATERDLGAVIASRIDQLHSPGSPLKDTHIPPMTPTTDMQLHAFAVELSTQLENVTVTETPERNVQENNDSKHSREQLREMFRARVRTAAQEAAAQGPARRAAAHEHTNQSTIPQIEYETSQDSDFEL